MSLLFSTHRFLSEFSTFGIGGPILYFAEVRTLEEMREAFVFAEQQRLKVFILGKGSNCLFDDLGFHGVVLLNKIDFCSWSGTEVIVGAGYSFSLLGVQSARKGLSGLEFAAGIPASVGGAVFMNAGANGKETCQSLRSVVYLHQDGRVEEYKREDLFFDYRISSFQRMQGAIISASFQLAPLESARESQLKILEHRMKSQPLKEKSIGCVFRNAEVAAGKLIDQCGLKEYRLGGAQVSCVHANFIVNVQGATKKDVVALIQHIQRQVKERTGVDLEPEIRIVPYE